VHKDKAASVGWEAIVNHHFFPLAVSPELKANDAGILVAEALVGRHHAVEEVFDTAQASDGS
jgi:hypothetical protein